MIKICINLSNRLVEKNLMIICIGIVYLLFGLLKFSPGLSSAEDVAIATIEKLTLGLIPSNVTIILLAIWESIVGLLLILSFYKRLVVTFTLVHMIFTFAPLFFFPELIFKNSPYFSFTLLGQYIFKNIIIISVLITLLYQEKRAISTN